MIKLTQEEKKYLLDSIRIIPDFPKKGIIFRDITTLLNNKEALNFLLRHLKERYKDYNLDFIAGTESRGFIFASMICAKLNLPLYLLENLENSLLKPLAANTILNMAAIK